MALRLIDAAADGAVSLTEAKAHLRVDHSDEDTYIGLLVSAAVDNAQTFLGMTLGLQTWELVIDAFPTAEIQIPLPPLREIVSVKYDDGDGVEQTMDPADYFVDTVSQPGWLSAINNSWPTIIDAPNSVRIRFIAGYSIGDSPAVDVPYAIKAGILLLIGTLYAHREHVVVGHITQPMPWGVEALLRPYRVLLGMA